MKALQKQRTYNSQRDSYRRKVEREQLDGYGWVMSLDSVRTPEEILQIKQRFAMLERHIDQLRPRIGRILRLRLGINCKTHTLEEIAKQYDVNKERIRQLEAQGVRIIKRRIWIEEKPEDYRRERENVAKAYAERRRLEREAELAQIQADNAAARAAAEERLRQSTFTSSQPRAADGKFLPSEAMKQSYETRKLQNAHYYAPSILDEIVKEQHRALALNERIKDQRRALARAESEKEQRRWAADREAWLRAPTQSWVAEREIWPQTPMPPLVDEHYPYKLRKVPIKRDWLKVATEGFSDGA